MKHLRHFAVLLCFLLCYAWEVQSAVDTGPIATLTRQAFGGGAAPSTRVLVSFGSHGSNILHLYLKVWCPNDKGIESFNALYFALLPYVNAYASDSYSAAERDFSVDRSRRLANTWMAPRENSELKSDCVSEPQKIHFRWPREIDNQGKGTPMETVKWREIGGDGKDGKKMLAQILRQWFRHSWNLSVDAKNRLVVTEGTVDFLNDWKLVPVEARIVTESQRVWHAKSKWADEQMVQLEKKSKTQHISRDPLDPHMHVLQISVTIPGESKMFETFHVISAYFALPEKLSARDFWTTVTGNSFPVLLAHVVKGMELVNGKKLEHSTKEAIVDSKLWQKYSSAFHGFADFVQIASLVREPKVWYFTATFNPLDEMQTLVDEIVGGPSAPIVVASGSPLSNSRGSEDGAGRVDTVTVVFQSQTKEPLLMEMSWVDRLKIESFTDLYFALLPFINDHASDGYSRTARQYEVDGTQATPELIPKVTFVSPKPTSKLTLMTSKLSAKPRKITFDEHEVNAALPGGTTAIAQILRRWFKIPWNLVNSEDRSLRFVTYEAEAADFFSHFGVSDRTLQLPQTTKAEQIKQAKQKDPKGKIHVLTIYPRLSGVTHAVYAYFSLNGVCRSAEKFWRQIITRRENPFLLIQTLGGKEYYLTEKMCAFAWLEYVRALGRVTNIVRSTDRDSPSSDSSVPHFTTMFFSESEVQESVDVIRKGYERNGGVTSRRVSSSRESSKGSSQTLNAPNPKHPKPHAPKP